MDSMTDSIPPNPPASERPTNPPLVPLNLDVNEAAHVLGCSRTTVYELMAAGDLASFKLGRRRLVPYAACVALSERLASV